MLPLALLGHSHYIIALVGYLFTLTSSHLYNPQRHASEFSNNSVYMIMITVINLNEYYTKVIVIY